MKDHDNAQIAQGEQQVTVPDQLKDKGLESPLQAEGEQVEDDALQPHSVTPAGYLSSFIDGVHQYVREFIALADQKAAFLFVASSTMLVYLYSQNVLELWWIPVGQWRFVSYIAFAATVSLFGGALCAVAVVWPRLKGAKEGFIFWKAIIRHPSRDDYVAKLLRLSDEALVENKAGHLYEIAAVCNRKYRWVNLSIWLSGSGLLAAVLLAVFGLR